MEIKAQELPFQDLVSFLNNADFDINREQITDSLSEHMEKYRQEAIKARQDLAAMDFSLLDSDFAGRLSIDSAVREVFWLDEEYEPELIFREKELDILVHDKTIFTTDYRTLTPDALPDSIAGQLPSRTRARNMLRKISDLKERFESFEQYLADHPETEVISWSFVTRGQQLRLSYTRKDFSQGSTPTVTFRSGDDFTALFEASVRQQLEEDQKAQALQAQHLEDMVQYCLAHNLAGSVTARVICDYLAQQPFVSVNIMVNHLRGLTLSTSQQSYLKHTEYDGRFSAVPPEMLENVTNTLIQGNILKLKYHSGSRSRYYTVEVTKDTPFFVSMLTEGRLRDGTATSEWNLEQRILSGSHPDNLQEEITLTEAMLQHPVLYSLHPEETVSYFNSCPEEILSYLKASRSGQKQPWLKRHYLKILELVERRRELDDISG